MVELRFGRRLRTLAVAGLIGVAVPAFTMKGWAIWLTRSGNVHEVEAGQVYRSAQLNGEALKSTLVAHDIRTVINLRGKTDGAAWYDDEIEVSHRMGVGHFDFKLSANQEPDDATMDRLLEIMRTAPKPILIHCKAGADRTGLAAALFELLIAGKSEQVAGQQLSLLYGHFPWLTSRTGAMDREFEIYGKRVTRRASPS